MKTHSSRVSARPSYYLDHWWSRGQPGHYLSSISVHHPEIHNSAISTCTKSFANDIQRYTWVLCRWYASIFYTVTCSIRITPIHRNCHACLFIYYILIFGRTAMLGPGTAVSTAPGGGHLIPCRWTQLRAQQIQRSILSIHKLLDALI